MGETSRLNKALWTNITRLKLLTKADAPVKFILVHNPFDDEDEEKVAVEQDEYVVTGKYFQIQTFIKKARLKSK
jgi:hypothetical protein